VPFPFGWGLFRLRCAVAKPGAIELPDGTTIPILYEDRAVLALDKPAGWLLAPDSWDRTGRNLSLAIQSSLRAGDYWARSRNLKFLRYVHRLDGDTSGVLLFAKNARAVSAYSRLFEGRQMAKLYLAVVRGTPPRASWVCEQKIGPDRQPGRMRYDPRHGKPALTQFRVLGTHDEFALVLAQPETGRTHQIRVHLQLSQLPVLGDAIYGPKSPGPRGKVPLGLRAILLAYRDPFTQKPVRIEAPFAEFVRSFGFEPPREEALESVHF
jgi:23S rRNA pseudouridine1911/1915/1917 synthase